jgi:hypothetical protein
LCDASIWDSYIAAVAFVSKTYAGGDSCCRRQPDRCGQFVAILMHVNVVTGQPPSVARSEPSVARSIEMLDIIMLAIGLGFFALSVGYAYACDRL